MKINWKVRLKNPVFWVTIIPAGITFVYCLMDAFGIVPAFAEETITNGLLAVITGLTTLGVLVDPTTEGLGDSEQALEYDEPKKAVDER